MHLTRTSIWWRRYAQISHFRRNRRNIAEVYQRWTRIFCEMKITEPTESITNILAKVLNTRNLAEVHQQRGKFLNESQANKVEEMCKKRLQSMPIQYIIGEWDFGDITLKMRPPVFIPRPETEFLTNLTLQHIRRRRIERVLELCCGSGAIALNLLHNEPTKVIAIDKSREACELCAENALELNLDERIQILNIPIDDFHLHFNAERQKFDLIVANPPYILRRDMCLLQPEIADYEDKAALDGGEDGLDVIRQILTLAARFLNPHGRLLLEVDPSHPTRVATAEDYAAELIYVGDERDLSGVARFVELMKR